MLASIVQNAPEYAIDVPYFYKYLGEVIGPMIYDVALPLNRVKDTLESVSSCSNCWCLLRILHDKDDNNKTIFYIDSECSNCKSDPYFIKDLTSMICNSTIKVEDRTNTCCCNKDELEKPKNILLKYIDRNKNLEFFALYGIQ
ncbi:uncharacterized protein LOC136081658 isoform X3 [Hydra vulgaris]